MSFVGENELVQLQTMEECKECVGSEYSVERVVETSVLSVGCVAGQVAGKYA